jgi:virulence factor Mce-like protein
MRRLLLALGLAAAIALATLVVRPSPMVDDVQRELQAKLLGVEPATYRVDAIFDTGRGVIPGQLVKVAGARVGAIDGVKLTPDYKVRVQMRVEKRFAPFRSDARCEVQPEGVIGERFVQCDPGTPSGRPLDGPDGGTPTVPVERTSLPVELNDVFEVFSAPARERFPIVVATLGLGLAGRGEDLNDILRRANPALAATRRVLGIVARQRRQLQDTIASSDRILSELGRRRESARRFLASAAHVTGQTASRRRQVSEAVRRLPPLLADAEPALRRAHEIAGDATPILADLQAAAPQLNRLMERAAPFAAVATPTLRDLRRVAPQARRAVRSASPVVKQVRGFASDALPTGRRLAALLGDLRDRGFVDNLLRTTSRLSATVSRYDSVSHLFGIGFFVDATSGCLFLAVRPNPNCRANYGATPTSRTASAGDGRALRSVLDYLLK